MFSVNEFMIDLNYEHCTDAGRLSRSSFPPAFRIFQFPLSSYRSSPPESDLNRGLVRRIQRVRRLGPKSAAKVGTVPHGSVEKTFSGGCEKK